MLSETASEEDMKATIFIENRNFAVWHAGDWTGPLSFQPDRSLSGDSPTSHIYDIVAVSAEGVKVIVVEISNLHRILKSGSTLYRKYLDRKSLQEQAQLDIISNHDNQNAADSKLLDDALKTLNVLELLGCNSALRKLNAVQKRHLESLAEGPIHFQPGERLWRAGTPVDKAFIIVSGSVSFTPKRRNAGSLSAAQAKDCDLDKHAEGNIGAEMHLDAKRAVRELGKTLPNSAGDNSEMASIASIETEEMNPSAPNTALPLNRVLIESGSTDPNHFEKLKRGLERRANNVTADGSVVSLDSSHDCDTESDSQYDYTFMDETDAGAKTKRTSMIRRRSSHARKANKVLGRLYNRRAFTGGLVFSRGHFLGDVSKMVAGLLASDVADIDQDGPTYGFGDQEEGKGDTFLSEQAIPEDAGEVEVLHSSTLTAGAEGCVVLVFPKLSLIPFLDQYPGLLLSLLGTQVVV
jgi:CRP-like cAMP-binding protein